MREWPSFPPKASGARISTANTDRYLHQADRWAAVRETPWAGPGFSSGIYWAMQPFDSHLRTGFLRGVIVGSLCSHVSWIQVICRRSFNPGGGESLKMQMSRGKIMAEIRDHYTSNIITH